MGKNVQFFKTYFLLKSTREKDSGWVESDFDIETKFLSTVIVEEKKCCLLSVSQTIFLLIAQLPLIHSVVIVSIFSVGKKKAHNKNIFPRCQNLSHLHFLE